MTQYNSAIREGVLLVDNLNTLLKLKTEASGFPGWVHSAEDEERYLESFWQSEEVWIEKGTITYNAAKRGLAKTDSTSCGVIDGADGTGNYQINYGAQKLYGFLATPGMEVMNFVFTNGDVVWISCKYGAQEHVPSLCHTNDVTACVGSICIAIWTR